MGKSLIEFFKPGGVFLFDEENSESERTFYKVEELMGEPEGKNITQTEVDEEGILCIFYDFTVLEEEQALEKYKKGEFVDSI